MELVKFTKEKFESLSKNIDTLQEMMVWAGPKYKFPLTFEQLKERTEQKIDNKQKTYLFNLFDDIGKETIGFIEIEILDNNIRLGSIQSVMIYKGYRGEKYSEVLLNLAITYAYDKLKLNSLELKVFSFNKPAISCYKKVGFVEEKTYDHTDLKTGKSFQLIKFHAQSRL